MEKPKAAFESRKKVGFVESLKLECVIKQLRKEESYSLQRVTEKTTFGCVRTEEDNWTARLIDTCRSRQRFIVDDCNKYSRLVDLQQVAVACSYICG